jgi:hypothetical protein
MRVSTSHDAAPGGSAPRYTDVVGVIVASERDAVTVRRRDGSLVQIAGDDVVAVRLLADAGPPRRTDPEQLQRMAARGWPAPVTEPLGQWLLRAADGFTGRANSVSVHGDPGMPLPAALRRVEDFYAATPCPLGRRWCGTRRGTTPSRPPDGSLRGAWVAGLPMPARSSSLRRSVMRWADSPGPSPCLCTAS